MKPNILLIVSDQHRRDWLGSAGGHRARLVHTPNLDALAARGLTFDAAYCAYPICGPSRMALMTGRRASRIGMFVNEHTLRSDVPTFAHALGRAGYETVLCGRMHFSGIDQRHGFERRLVGDLNASYGGGPERHRNTEKWESSNSVRAATVGRGGDADTVRYDMEVAEAASHYLTDRTTRGEERPLLMVTGFFQPHHPFVAPPEDYERALARLEAVGDEPAPVPSDDHPHLQDLRGNRCGGELDADQVRRARAAYAGMIDHLDRLIGQVLEAARSLPGPTLVIYTSDHGEMAGDQKLWGKTVFPEASVGVPMIMAPLSADHPIPDLPLTARRTVRAPVSLLDLAPTLAGIAGAPALPGIDGVDLTPLLRDPDDAPFAQRAVLSELCIRFPTGDGRLAVNEPATAMIRRGPWKLVYYHPNGRDWEDPVSLHNLAEDPLEQHNRAHDPACAEVRRELLERLRAEWDPDWVDAEANARAFDLAYTTAWGRAIGQSVLGTLECWSPGRAQWKFGLPGVREE